MNGFDIERAEEAAKMMEGLHDFRSFMKKSGEQKTVNFEFSSATAWYLMIIITERIFYSVPC